MLKHTIFIILLVPGLILNISKSALAEENEIKQIPDKAALVLGVFPRRNAIVTTRMFTPLVKYLSRKLKRPVKLMASKDFPDFWDNIKKNKYDIVHYNQYHYVKSHKEFGYQVILKNIEQGESTIAGSIIVRKNSGITTLLDLKGKDIVFGGGPKAMQSHIVARYLLMKAGLKNTDYNWSYTSNPPNAIISTYLEQSEAAGSGDKVLQLKVVKKQIDIDEMMFLAKGEQLSQLPWALNKNISESLSFNIQNILIDLTKTSVGLNILSKIRLDGFASATDDDYNPHRKIIEAVLKESY